MGYAVKIGGRVRLVADTEELAEYAARLVWGGGYEIRDDASLAGDTLAQLKEKARMVSVPVGDRALQIHVSRGTSDDDFDFEDQHDDVYDEFTDAEVPVPPAQLANEAFSRFADYLIRQEEKLDRLADPNTYHSVIASIGPMFAGDHYARLCWRERLERDRASLIKRIENASRTVAMLEDTFGCKIESTIINEIHRGLSEIDGSLHALNVEERNDTAVTEAEDIAAPVLSAADVFDFIRNRGK